ncbi:FAD-binding oxidoreductase [Bradyrhizobium brasilense]|uniref:NAD(P)/FAD-dependent oxidoreductase n=1 Tax=Bradyrhizobium brasilense TaxID=1419277 RepID=UPI002877BFA3|nr:FAD-dependent oxidoreductase [Bradyrhizobium brasilense]MCP3417876.1 FAD-binding oxidoreductase [Bradyrhizobium brasilense]
MLVAVVGAGIMGASLSLHLAGNEMTVLLFDSAAPGSGATGSSFACLNFFAGTTPNYMQFMSEALDYHEELARQIGLADTIRATGTLRWSTESTQTKELLQAASMAEGLGRRVEYLSRNDALDLEPNLRIGGAPEVIVRAPQEGWLDSVRFTKRMIDAAVATGLAHHICEKCTRIEPIEHGGAELWTNRTSYLVDAVVLAGGIGVNALLEDLACAPLFHESPAVLTQMQYLGPRIEHVVFANQIHFRTNGPSSLIVGNADDPMGVRDSGVMAGKENVSLVRRELKEPSLGESIVAQRGTRPVPKDGYPIVGRLPGQEQIFIAVTHAGVTLAPYVALLLTTEIARDGSCKVLGAFRPERFNLPIDQNKIPRI